MNGDMTLEQALGIVLSLAEDGALDEKEAEGDSMLLREVEEQQTAIRRVSQLKLAFSTEPELMAAVDEAVSDIVRFEEEVEDA